MIPDFIALDIETANSDLASICAIGLVRFSGGKAVHAFSRVLNPEDYFDPINAGIHGITEEMVLSAPLLRTAYPIIVKNLADCIVVHHSPFDRTAFNKAGLKFGYAPFDYEWLDTCRVARRAWPPLRDTCGYGLKALSRELKITFKHHDPAEDARACGEILVKAISASGISLPDWPKKLRTYEEKLKSQMGRPEGHLHGETITFTGSLQISRSKAADLAAEAGCDVSPSVSKRTTLLVIGDQDLRLLNGHQKSTKHRKAEEMIAQGYPIKLLGETDFMTMLRLPA